MPSTTNVKDGPNDASNGKSTTADENGAKTVEDEIKAADSGRYIYFFCIGFVDWFMASFRCCFPYSYRCSNY